MKKLYSMVALFPTMIVLALTSNARAADIFCPPFIEFETVGNVIVDDLCIIRGSTIEGSIKVGPGGSVGVIGTAENPSTVEGNFESDGGVLVQAIGAVHIKGDVIIKNTGPGPSGLGGLISLRRIVDGNVKFENNSGIVLSGRATIGGNMSLVGNTAGADVFSNVIGGNLECSDNAAPPEAEVRFAVGGNVVGGNELGQCAGF